MTSLKSNRTYEIITDYKNYDFSFLEDIPVQKLRPGNQGGNKKKLVRYKNIVCAFDIETTAVYYSGHTEISRSRFNKIKRSKDDKLKSTLKCHSIPYIWQFAIGEKKVFVGRYLSEYIDFLKTLQSYLKYYESLCIYVHNLSYEFMFLKGLYPFYNDEIFAVDRRKVLKCTMFNQFEHRCSYIQSNMSLSEFTKKMDVPHQKLSGEEFNYNKKRMPWTKMTDKELEYCCHDVVGLVEAMTVQMSLFDDTLQTVPLTSTGYVRRDCKASLKKYALRLMEIAPDLKLYELLREMFRGGDTHANRYYAGTVLEDLDSYDISSSYPAQLSQKKYPMHKFIFLKDPPDLSGCLRFMAQDKALCIRVAFKNIRLKDPYFGCPYLSKFKCHSTNDTRLIGGVLDNGRVLSYLEDDSDDGWLYTSITDIDLKIILKEYEWEASKVLTVAYSKYEYLPKEFVEVIRSYFIKKTDLKGVDEMAVYYNKIKNMINALYGMCAQNPVKQDLVYDGRVFREADDDEWDILEGQNKKGMLPYQIGVWCTAHARYALHRGIWLVGDDFVYCDTDSIKCLGDHRADFLKLNEELKETSKITNTFAYDKKGVCHYMGMFEMEDPIFKFKTLGAKKYVYQHYFEKELHVTIAGVNKVKGAKELMSLGGFDAFSVNDDNPTVFYEGGGSDLYYNDAGYLETIFTYFDKKTGRQLDVTSNVCITDGFYTLGITDEYERILSNPDLFLKAYHLMFQKEIIS